MKELVFNKEITKAKKLRAPHIIFNKLPDTGGKARYQGGFNTTAKKLIDSIIDQEYLSIKVVYSDEHATIGFKPSMAKSTKYNFNATELFLNLSLVVGKRYSVKKHKNEMVVIDSNEYE